MSVAESIAHMESVRDDPGSKLSGAIVEWDPDGSCYGDFEKATYRSLQDYVERALGRATKRVAKGLPVPAGIAHGALPSDDQMPAIVAALAKRAKCESIRWGVDAIARTPALRVAVVSGLLAVGVDLVTNSVYDKLLLEVAPAISPALLLEALTKRTSPVDADGPLLLKTWSVALDGAIAVLLRRAPDEVAKIGPRLPPNVAEGVLLTRVRLGLAPLAEIPHELLARLVKQGSTEAIKPFFPDWSVYEQLQAAHWRAQLADYRRHLEATLSSAQPWREDQLYPALMVATGEELARLFDLFTPYSLRLLPFRLPNRDTEHGLVRTLIDAAGSVTTDRRNIVAWTAYIAAHKLGQPLPAHDDWLDLADPLLDRSDLGTTFETEQRGLLATLAREPGRIDQLIARAPAREGELREALDRVANQRN
jgi:hypothetical protein